MQQPIIIKNFPGGYGEAIALPTIISTLGIGRYGLDLDGKWWEISHQVWSHNWDYSSNKTGEQDQAAWIKIKEYLASKGCGAVYGWRGTLSDREGEVLWHNCHGMDKSYHDKCKREFRENEVIDFNDYKETMRSK